MAQFHAYTYTLISPNGLGKIGFTRVPPMSTWITPKIGRQDLRGTEIDWLWTALWSHDDRRSIGVGCYGNVGSTQYFPSWGVQPDNERRRTRQDNKREFLRIRQWLVSLVYIYHITGYQALSYLTRIIRTTSGLITIESSHAHVNLHGEAG